MEETNLSVHTLESPQDYLAICPDRDETNFSSRYIVTKYYLYTSFFAKSQHCRPEKTNIRTRITHTFAMRSGYHYIQLKIDPSTYPSQNPEEINDQVFMQYR